jgi:hypothetical protein
MDSYLVKASWELEEAVLMTIKQENAEQAKITATTLKEMSHRLPKQQTNLLVKNLKCSKFFLNDTYFNL